MAYKKFLKRITIIFVCILVFLTFFSRTLLDLSVPRVSLAFVGQGSIRPEARSTGIVSRADTERIFAPASGRITQILQSGDETDSQTVLFTISSDLQSLKDSLQQAEHELQVNALAIEQAIANRSDAQLRLSQLQNQPLDIPPQPTLNLWEFDMQLDTNTANIESIQSDIATLEILYAEGIIPRQDITNRESDLEQLLQSREEIYTRRNMAIENHETSLENYEDSIAANQRARQDLIQSQQNIITGHNFTVSSHNMERDRIETCIANLNEQIEDGGVVYVQLAEHPNRIITEISPGIDIGTIVVEGAPILTTAIRNNRFEIQASFPRSQDFIRPNQDVDITIGTTRLEGTTTRIVPDGGHNLVYIQINTNQLVGGELVHVIVSGGNFPHDSIIPLSALRQDQNGYYILFIEPSERFFGNDYIVHQMQVEPTRRDARNVAISARWGLELPEGPIVVNSDMPVIALQRVRPVASHDFIPTR